MNNLKKIIFAFFIFSSTIAYAAEKPVVGVISAAVGEIYNQNNKKLNSGDKIYFGDSIIVKDKSNSQILLLDETVMSVGSNSEIKIDEFIYDPKTKDGKILSQIKSGSMKVLTGGVSEKNPANLEIKVPAGTIGTRGTEFQATVDATNSQSKILLIGPGPGNSLGLRPGAVEVQNNLGKVLLDKPFLFTQMSATTAPQAPIPVPQNELKQFQQRLETKAAPVTTQVATEQKATTEKALFSGDLKKENIIQQIIKNPDVVGSLDNQLGATGAVKISSIVNEQGIVNSQVAINELSKMADKGTITSQDFFSLVGKDDKGNLIVTNGKADATAVTTPVNSTANTVNKDTTTGVPGTKLNTSGLTETYSYTINDATLANTVNKDTTTGVPGTKLNTSGLTGTYSYTINDATFTREAAFAGGTGDAAKSNTNQSFSNVTGFSKYNSTTLVDFTNKTIKTNYNGNLTWYDSFGGAGNPGPYSSTNFSITSNGATFTGTPTEQFNFKLVKGTGASSDANLTNYTSLPLVNVNGTVPTNLSSYAGNTNTTNAAAFGNFNNGTSTFVIERYNCTTAGRCAATNSNVTNSSGTTGPINEAYSIERLTGNTTITTATPTKQ